MTAPFALTPDALLSHEAFVLRLARSLTRDEASAHDLAQDTMMAALKSPPITTSPRGWFAAVMRNRAAEKARMQHRRSAREETVARAEAVATTPALSIEQLELNHGVVQAVLELSEPYKSVVAGVYYEGKSPKELGARRGVPASTVRSQLSRALDQLKIKLDAEHGGRSAWAAGLIKLVQADASTPVRAVGSVGVSSTVLTIGWVAAAALAASGLWMFLTHEPAGLQIENSAALAAPLSPDAFDPSATPTVVARPLPPIERERIAASSARTGMETTPATVEFDDVPAALVRMRQLKAELLDRALRVPESESAGFEWLANERNAGVVRILERNIYGHDFNLPWMRGGGSYYSFTERVHDFNRSPQISFEGGQLRSNSGYDTSIDLGSSSLRTVGTAAGALPGGLSLADSIEWDLCWADYSQDDRSIYELRSDKVDQLFRSGGLTEEECGPILNRADGLRIPQVGHCYLARIRSRTDFDLLIALEVLGVDANGCNIAWRELKRWPTANARPLWKPKMLREQLPASEDDLTLLSDEQLQERLAMVKDAGRKLLFHELPDEVESRFGHLRGQDGCGVARLLPYLGAWAELGEGFVHSAAISPLTGKYDSAHLYLGFQGSGPYAKLETGFSGGINGVVAELGSIDLEDVDRVSAVGRGGAKVELALNFKFEQLPYEPNKPGFDSERRSFERAQQSAFRDALKATGLQDRAVAVVGRTYLVRAFAFDDRDVLFAVHVADMDEYGAIVAWRVLESSQMRLDR